MSVTERKHQKRKVNYEPKRTTPASSIWFEIPADDLARAKRSYGRLFGWKINPFPREDEKIG